MTASRWREKPNNFNCKFQALQTTVLPLWAALILALVLVLHISPFCDVRILSFVLVLHSSPFCTALILAFISALSFFPFFAMSSWLLTCQCGSSYLLLHSSWLFVLALRFFAFFASFASFASFVFFAFFSLFSFVSFCRRCCC